MLKAVESPFLVPFEGSFRYAQAHTSPPDKSPGEMTCEKQLEELIGKLDEIQRKLYAHDRYAVLLIFQAMDAAGKDSTIRAVLRGVNPAGCQVFSFKQPGMEELKHDFLWRTSRCLPEKGRIGVFNRSYYEEVLVVRVHPEFLEAQKLPSPLDLKNIWKERYESILEHEKHLAGNGTVIIKFWLNVSFETQTRRFLSRMEHPDKNWKFSDGDLAERRFWKDYMQAYEHALNATSRPWAPWYSIPADDKSFMHLAVADIIVRNLETLGCDYPAREKSERLKWEKMKHLLEKEVREAEKRKR